MCDTFVALPSFTADGSLIFGKNSDRQPNEAQVLEYHPPADHPPTRRLRCTYRSLPQARHTHGVLLSRPFWMWGAEMGANDRGVVIGNEPVFTRLPKVKEGQLIGMDLLRLALERSASAQAALQTIVSLLADYGQGGVHGYGESGLVYHNSFLIAGPGEAWVLETAGPLWAALRVRDRYAISNALTIGEQYDAAHPELVETARRRGWLRPGLTFHFARCYSDWLYTTFGDGRTRRSRAEKLLDACRPRAPTRRRSDRLTRAGGLTTADAVAILRDHGGPEPYLPDGHLLMSHLCSHSANSLVRHSAQSTGSLVASLGEAGNIFWVTGTSAPCTSVFKPVWLQGRVLPELGPAAKGHYDPKTLWWRHENLHRRILADYPARIRVIQKEQRELEESYRASAAAASPRKRFAVTAEAFRRSGDAEERWVEAVQGLEIERRPGRVFLGYWSAQNRSAGLPRGT